MISHGLRFFRNPNCPLMPLSGRAGRAGTHRWTNQRVATPHRATIRNISLHDTSWVMYVPSGTPITLATVMPAIISDTARAVFPSSATFSATIEPTPKNAPWGSPEMNRKASITPYDGASAVKRLPSRIIATSP